MTAPTPDQRAAAREHALMKLRAAKAQYIAGRITFDQLWGQWWSTDITNRPAVPMEWSLRQLVVEAMELEKAKYLDRPVQLVNQSLPIDTKES